MKIGLAGVPGSGKTDLAKALEEKFSKDGKSICIIDNYVPDIEKDVNLALSFSAAYLGNLHVAMTRAAMERKAEDDVIITCGTLFETSSYTVQSLEDDYSLITRDNDKYDFAQRSEATMRILACFYIDLVKYDYIFHLSTLTKSEEENINKLELNLQAAFQAFNLFEHIVLEADGSTSEEIVNNRVTKVMEAINADNTKKQNVQAKESNGSGV